MLWNDFGYERIIWKAPKNVLDEFDIKCMCKLWIFLKDIKLNNKIKTVFVARKNIDASN